MELLDITNPLFNKKEGFSCQAETVKRIAAQCLWFARDLGDGL
jgi:hypothetical protein